MSSNLVSVPHEGESPEQSEFEGMPVRQYAFALKSASKLYTEKPLAWNLHVRGWFEGRVKAVTFGDGAEDGMMRLHMIEVLDAGLEE